MRNDTPDIAERDIVTALDRFQDFWPALIPAEQARITSLLVARVTVDPDGLAVDLREDGAKAMVREMLRTSVNEAAE